MHSIVGDKKLSLNFDGGVLQVQLLRRAFVALQHRVPEDCLAAITAAPALDAALRLEESLARTDVD